MPSRIKWILAPLIAVLVSSGLLVAPPASHAADPADPLVIDWRKGKVKFKNVRRSDGKWATRVCAEDEQHDGLAIRARLYPLAQPTSGTGWDYILAATDTSAHSYRAWWDACSKKRLARGWYGFRLCVMRWQQRQDGKWHWGYEYCSGEKRVWARGYAS